jgi:hypothetical protein
MSNSSIFRRKDSIKIYQLLIYFFVFFLLLGKKEVSCNETIGGIKIISPENFETILKENEKILILFIDTSIDVNYENILIQLKKTYNAIKSGDNLKVEFGSNKLR